jgi:hypothetical protein
MKNTFKKHGPRTIIGVWAIYFLVCTFFAMIDGKTLIAVLDAVIVVLNVILWWNSKLLIDLSELSLSKGTIAKDMGISDKRGKELDDLLIDELHKSESETPLVTAKKLIHEINGNANEYMYLLLKAGCILGIGHTLQHPLKKKIVEEKTPPPTKHKEDLQSRIAKDFQEKIEEAKRILQARKKAREQGGSPEEDVNDKYDWF